MQRTSRKHLEFQVTRINKLLDRPTTAYTKGSDGSFHANIGNFHISSCSPGDGKTRYSLHEMMNEAGGVNLVGSRSFLGSAEFYVFLTGIVYGLDAMAAQVIAGARKVQDQPSEDDGLTCPECGKENEAGFFLCTRCGADMRKDG